MTYHQFSDRMKFTFSVSLLILLFSCIRAGFVSAQTTLDEATRTAEVWPQWPGCNADIKDCTKSKLNAFLAEHLHIPTEAKAQGAGGVVMVEFVVEKNGTVGEVRALHDPGLGLGEEAVRVVGLMAEKKIRWIPAEEKGKRIPFRYMTPVSFNLERPVKVQKESISDAYVPAVYDVAEVMPRYAGCEPTVTDSVDCTFISMIRHIQANLTYPDSALAANAQGPVVVQFIIDAQGNVTQPVVAKGLGFGLDEEAIRVISIMPTWQPGMQGGKPVPVRMNVPILFQIPKPEKE
jgi:TonB family protein